MDIVTKLFIGGEWVDGVKRIKVYNPSDGSVISEVSEADEKQVIEAVESAEKSYQSGIWSGKSVQERADVLGKIGRILRERSEEFAQVETVNVGKPIKESRFIDIPAAIDTFEYYASIANCLVGECPDVGKGIIDFTRREPLGVVGLITPWNFPLLLASRKLAPAILAGNSVVLKPAELTPLTTLMLGKIIQEAGVSDGVVNIVVAKGAVAGKVFTGHKSIRKVSFTGSTEVGQKILCSCAGDFKANCMEMGGKSPAIVSRYADVDKAIDGVLFGAFLNQGECCCAATRLLLDKPIADEFVSKLTKAIGEKIIVGNPLDEANTMGPLISKGHLETVNGYVERALRDGAKEIYRGHLALNLPKNGNWYPPVLIEAEADMEIYREEVFGPVLTVTVFDGIDELIRAANDSEYGLAASIFTENMSEAERAIREIEAGTVWVNVHNFVFNAAPYGGYKHSGIGRECGVEGLLAYTQIKNAIVYAAGERFSWYR